MALHIPGEIKQFRAREAHYVRALQSVEDAFNAGDLNGEHADAETARLYDEWNELDETCSHLCHDEGHPSYDEQGICVRCGVHK